MFTAKARRQSAGGVARREHRYRCDRLFPITTASFGAFDGRVEQFCGGGGDIAEFESQTSSVSIRNYQGGKLQIERWELDDGFQSDGAAPNRRLSVGEGAVDGAIP